MTGSTHLLGEGVPPVVYQDPAQPPPGHHEPLADPTARQHRHVRTEGGHRVEVLATEYLGREVGREGGREGGREEEEQHS